MVANDRNNLESDCAKMKKILVVAALLALAACGEDSADSSKSAGSGDTPAAASGLTYQAVEALTAERLTTDPDCPVGTWDDNSTGVDEKYRADVAAFKQFDCYEKEAKGFPHRVQQSKYVEFRTAATARAYAEDEAKMYMVLIAGNTVVVAGSGLESVDMKGYLGALRAKAGSGEILGS